MKIVELGYTGVGKTTYMSSLYGTLQKPVQGFSLRANNDSDHLRFLKLAEKVKYGQYPAPSDQRSEYNFFLQYKGENIFSFDWLDYRGGTLLETQDNQQAKTLTQDLEKAEGMMMFCDAQTLSSKNHRKSYLSRMINLVNYALNNRPYMPLSLVIILTKLDLVGGKIDPEMLTPLQSLIAAIKLSKCVKGAIVPIACGAKPINIEIPLLFLLNTGVELKVKNLEREIAYHELMAKVYQEKSQGIFGMVRDVWFDLTGQDSYSFKSETEIDQALAKNGEYNKIIQPVKLLGKYLYYADIRNQIDSNFPMLIN